MLSSITPRQRSTTVVVFEWAHWLNGWEFPLISQGRQTGLTDGVESLGCRWVCRLNLREIVFGAIFWVQGGKKTAAPEKKMGMNI